METIAKLIILCMVTTVGAAAGITYLYDPGVFRSSLESNPISNSQNYKTEDINSSKLSYYKKHLLEDSQVDIQPPENINPKPEQLWTETYDKPEPPESYPLQEAKKLADKNSLKVLEEKMDYWYQRYQKALQSGQIQGSNYAYSQYANYKEALEIKRGYL
ncbi:MAG: hypothetical protein ACM3SR_03700 [Ignavibacteriales bacterium]